MEFKRGQIVMVDLGIGKGSIQGNKRPCVILQNNVGCKYSPTLIVAPITSKLNKKGLPTHINLGIECGLLTDSIALLEQIITINKSQVENTVGEVNEDIQKKLNIGIMVSLGMFDIRSNTVTM